MRFLLVSFLVFSLQLSAAEPSEADLLKKYKTLADDSPQTQNGLTDPERVSLLHYLDRHPVASPDLVEEYEPFPGIASRQIGYCFGRAMAAHLRSRTMKVKSENIKKLFIIGDLRSGPDPEWMFHVTTLVRDENDEKNWFAIDPIMKPYTGRRSQTAQAWIDTVRSVWDKEKKANLYLVDNSVIIPEIRKDNPMFVFVSDPAKGLEKFDPTKEKGFTVTTKYSRTKIYELSAAAEEKYFIGVNDKGDDAFPFLGIWLRDETGKPLYFSFMNYFAELLDSLAAVEPAQAAMALELAPKEPTPAKLRLQSVAPAAIQGKKVKTAKQDK